MNIQSDNLLTYNTGDAQFFRNNYTIKMPLIVLCSLLLVINAQLYLIGTYNGQTPFYFHQFSAHSGDNFEVVCANCLSSTTGLEVKFQLYKAGTNLAFTSNILEEAIQYLRYSVQQTASYFIRVVKTGGDISDQYCIQYTFNGVQQSNQTCQQIRRHILSPPAIGSFLKIPQSPQYCYYKIVYTGGQASITFSTLDYSQYSTHGSQIQDRNTTAFQKMMGNPQLSNQYFIWINMAPPIISSHTFVIQIYGNDLFYWDQPENRCRMPCTDNYQWNQTLLMCTPKQQEQQQETIIDGDSADNQNALEENDMIPVIAGAVGGGILVLVGIFIFVYCRFFRKKTLESVPQESHTKDNIEDDLKAHKLFHKQPNNSRRKMQAEEELYQRDYASIQNKKVEPTQEQNMQSNLKRKKKKQKKKNLSFSQLSQKRKTSLCPVCLAFQCNITLACGHHSHQICLEEWFKRNTFCPTCGQISSPTKIEQEDIANPYRQPEVQAVKVGNRNKRD